jgi:RNA polymerase-binding transcription factor DksA
MNTSAFEKKLQDEKELLLRELKEIGVVKDSKDPENWQATPGKLDILEADSNEVGDRISSYENNNALVNDLEHRLREVEAALDKIKKGNYGICEICGKPIEEDRLSANPAAKTCKEHMNG